jgi:hypothetical protein
MLTRDTGFDMAIVLPKEGSGVGEPAAELGHQGSSRETVLCNAASTASLTAHEHIGAWPCPCALAWTLPPAPLLGAQVPQGSRVLPLTRPCASLAHSDVQPLMCVGRYEGPAMLLGRRKP